MRIYKSTFSSQANGHHSFSPARVISSKASNTYENGCATQFSEIGLSTCAAA